MARPHAVRLPAEGGRRLELRPLAARAGAGGVFQASLEQLSAAQSGLEQRSPCPEPLGTAFQIDSFLSEAECDRLIELARQYELTAAPTLSTVNAAGDTGGAEGGNRNWRNSSTAWLPKVRIYDSTFSRPVWRLYGGAKCLVMCY
jgi:hypothetical protein